MRWINVPPILPEFERSRGWIIAAVIPAIGFIAGLGPGVRFRSP